MVLRAYRVVAPKNSYSSCTFTFLFQPDTFPPAHAFTSASAPAGHLIASEAFKVCNVHGVLNLLAATHSYPCWVRVRTCV